MVLISNNRKHDQHVVQHFVGLANNDLIAYGVKFEHDVHFLDGAPSQYKSKLNFVEMTHCQEDFGFPIEKYFFRSRHGKGPCDGEIGVVKGSALTADSTGPLYANERHPNHPTT